MEEPRAGGALVAEEAPCRRPEPGVTIAVVNQKGGVGKTTTCLNLAAGLAALGHRTLAIDLDPQANLTLGLGVDPDGLERTTYGVLCEDVDAASAVVATGVDRLDLLPSDVRLAGAEVRLAEAVMGEVTLRERIAPLAARYPYVLIDAPPNLGLLTLNAIAAASDALVPVQTQYYALRGIQKLLQAFRVLASRMNHHVRVRILATMVDRRVKLSKTVLSEIERHFAENRFAAVIRTDAKLSEAPLRGEPVLRTAPSSRGATDYRRLAREAAAHYARAARGG